MTTDQWWSSGTFEDITLGGQTRTIYCRRVGHGPSITLLHGFPSSSHDWAAVAEDLADDYSLLMPDLLGFGASEKPADHAYTMSEQADLLEALWARDGITETTLVAHDYSATVAQELLARRSAGRLSVDVAALVLMNGGIYPDLHRPEPIQFALLDPDQGPQVSSSLTAEKLAVALAPTFAPDFDSAPAVASIWSATSRDHVNLHDTIAYIPDRRRNADRWVGALEGTDVPLTFVWGMLDPVSGAHMIARVHEQIPTATINELAHVGHWPPLEAPNAVLAAIRRA